jgi:hypothetical protein
VKEQLSFELFPFQTLLFLHPLNRWMGPNEAPRTQWFCLKALLCYNWNNIIVLLVSTWT